MKYLLIVCLLFSATYCFAQTDLSKKDFDNLVALAQLHSKNNMARGEAFKKSADSLRTPVLDGVIETLITLGRGDTTVLQQRVLKRPSNDELKLWYVLRDVHYNNIDKNKVKSAEEVARETLKANINEKWLVDNYYRNLAGGLATMFNEADISKRNIDVNQLGLKDDTEKSIAFLDIADALLRGRLRVLSHLKNVERLNMYISHIPTFNGKPYYYFTPVIFNPAEWEGYTKEVPFDTQRIGGLLEILLIHLNTKMNAENADIAKDIYWNSMLSKPEYFKHSNQSKVLQDVYDKSGKGK
ncbi:hypothetical protein IM792_08640 [Mucilaginibacter sp. JRF]|uniref:hypothetical protein n=1 Tax=Mucilaginibacter sp. JRF TaxID=2780088 RepID=UPI0018813FE7|nr:hypothetical protein [Mucilaginibacter sp. JRF]MBE9584511.1 hypothetical protein [Mucilaginibacter sp. JRF]